MSGIELIDREHIRKLLIEQGWIVFNFPDDGFAIYLENTYFTPGTKKNAEFEIAFGPITTPNGMKLTAWMRIKDTKVNRRNLKEAVELYYRSKLSIQEFEKGLSRIRKEISENLEAWFPNSWKRS